MSAPFVVTELVEPSYLWLACLLVALAWAVISATRLGLDSRVVYWTGVAGIALGLLGSHLLGLVVYDSDGLSWWRVWVGGKAWYGGLIGGALGALVVLRLSGRPVLRYADAIAPAVMLGYAIGRIGCFFHGDDYGTPTSLPWAIRYGADTEALDGQVAQRLIDPQAALTVPIHPTQLYHSLFGLVLFVILSRIPAEPPGRRLGFLAAGYGIGRFFLEWVRGDFSPLALGLSLQQWISVGLIAIGAAILAGVTRARTAPGDAAVALAARAR